MRSATAAVSLAIFSATLAFGSLFADTKDKFPDPTLKAEKVIAAEPGMKIYQASATRINDRKFSVYIPKSFSNETPAPMVISAYDEDPEAQCKYWGPMADKYGFIVVCPDYRTVDGCKNHAGGNLQQEVRNDSKMLKEIADRVFRSLNIDRRFVMHAACGGGGLPAYYVAMSQPKIFTCFAVNSAIFWGEKVYGTNFFVMGKPTSNTWSSIPVYVSWEKGDLLDRPDGYGKMEGPEAVKFFTETLRCKNVKQEVYKAGEQKLPQMPSKWFAEDIIGSNAAVKSPGANGGK